MNSKTDRRSVTVFPSNHSCLGEKCERRDAGRRRYSRCRRGVGGGQAEEDEQREDEDERMRWEASWCHFRKREKKKTVGAKTENNCFSWI